MKTIFFLLLVIISSSFLYSQRKFTNEFSLINDNDLYTSLSQDRYYTNGTFLTYKWLSNFSSKKAVKKIYKLQLGQHIYSPFVATVFSVAKHDRPFAGYLYNSFGIHNFYRDKSAFKISAQVGVIGTSSLAKETMRFVHNLYGFKEAIGWKYQIANAFALNFEGTYIKYLGSDISKTLDVSWYNNAKAGIIFTNFSTGLYSRVGFKPLQDITNSIAFGSNFNGKNTSFNNEVEVFFYLKPTVSYVVYDATIEGSFLNNNSPVTYNVKPFKFTTELGLRFTSNKFNFGYSVFYHTKKLKSIKVPATNFYGSIQINYQFN